MHRILVLVGLVLLLFLPVAAAVAERSAVVSSGLSGSWYSPETDGQGFVFDVVAREKDQPNQLVVYWFTYAMDAGGPESQRWMLAEGEFFWGESSVSLEVLQFTGGRFDQPGGVQSKSLGTAELTIQNCSKVILDYDLDFDSAGPVKGTIELERLTPDVLCKQLPEVSLEVPEAVAPGESFEVIYRITNPGPVDLSMQTPHSCIGHVRVFRDGEPAKFTGENTFCLTVITIHQIPVGESLEWVHQLTAASGDSVVSPGTYTVGVKSQVRSINGVPDTLPDIERDIEVK